MYGQCYVISAQRLLHMPLKCCQGMKAPADQVDLAAKQLVALDAGLLFLVRASACQCMLWLCRKALAMRA
jgi:hypothetical protein